MKVTRVEKHIIKLNNQFYNMLYDFCFKSKNLYNYANYHVRQCFIILSKLSEGKKISEQELEFINTLNSKVDDYNNKRLEKYKKDLEKGKKVKEPKIYKYFNTDNKFINYEFNDFICKGYDYSNMPAAQSAQQCLRLLDKNWKSFFKSIKDWTKHKDKYLGKPKLPKYLKKDGRNILILTNINCKVKNGFVVFPKSFDNFKLKTKVKENLQQVRILPRYKAITIEVVYKTETKDKLEDNKRYLSIDLGLDNLATIVNNVGKKPIVINGKSLKSINQYYNKKSSYYKSISKQMNNLDYTSRLNKLTVKRNSKITDYMHKASRFIIDYAIKLNCNTIVVGNNKSWKQESNMSKVNNQNFISIPHKMLIDMLSYKAENVGLNIIITEESYTSGTSFLDNEEPTKENYNKARRIKRGLFKSNFGKLINADVNGAYQILKKVFLNVFNNTDRIEGVGLHPVRVSL